MLPYPIETHDFSLNVLRRKELLEELKHAYPDKDGIVVLFAGFEGGRTVFRQESSFYYMTGIREPGVVLVMNMNGLTELYVPNCDTERAKWVNTAIALKQENAVTLGVAKVHYLGEQCAGYAFHPFFPQHEYVHLLERMDAVIKAGGSIFTLTPDSPSEYVEQRMLVQRLTNFLPNLGSYVLDISPLVADMRRKKDRGEIELMYKAVEITLMAQEAAAHSIADEMTECEVQANLEYMFTGSTARAAFPSIVGSGKNSTVLHYVENNSVMRNGGLVVVDIGAEFEYYCADITRTYPVSGTFTARQREVYNVVLDTQEYIANLAKPGMWLSNKEHPEQSLNHLAKAYMAKRGYGKYFIHGIGHFLGLDVHDVGDLSKPLQEGDVITIEPGIYIAEEQIGIRIEDDYWIVRDGVICLSEHLPKKADDIEAMMRQRSFDAPAEQESEDYEFDDEDEEMEMND